MKAQRSSARYLGLDFERGDHGISGFVELRDDLFEQGVTSALWSPENRCLPGTCQTRSRPGTILERTGDRRRAWHPPGVVLGEVESVAVALQVAERLGIGAGVLAEVEDVLEVVGPLDPWTEMRQAP